MENNSELEIELTLESGLVCDFVPDFKLSANYADKDKVSWRLSNDLTKIDVGVLFPSIQAKNSIRTPGSDRDNM